MSRQAPQRSANRTDGYNRTAHVPALIRLARALRAMHREQVYAMECLHRRASRQKPTR